MTYTLDDDNTADIPARALNFPGIQQGTATFSEVSDAAFNAQWLEVDSWRYSDRKQREMQDRLSQAAGFSLSAEQLALPAYNQRQLVFDAARAAFEGVPDSYQSMPLTEAEFQSEINRQLRDEYGEATAVLDNASPGAWGAELWGRLKAGVVDDSTIATLPIGPGAGGLVRTVLAEGAAGVAGEALTMNRQFEMSDRLDIAPPDVTTQLAIAGVTSGVLGGGIHLGGRGLSYGMGDDPARVPAGVTPLEHEQLLAEAERILTFGDQAGPMGAFPDDYASPLAPPRPRVAIEFNLGPDRPNPPNQPVLDVIGAAVERVLGPDARVVVTSGQEGSLPQHGSNRHRSGDAADIAVYRADGSIVRATDPDMLAIAEAAAEGGAKGTGFGSDYMGGDHIHIDLVAPGADQANTWGDVGTANRAGLSAIMSGAAPARRRAPPTADEFDYSRAGNASPVGNRIGYVFGRLMERGYTPEQAAGLLGNFMVESGPTLNLQAVGDGGNAYGMAQWNGPRKRAYLAFARAQGADPGDIDVQIAFVDHELRTTHAEAGQRLRRATTAEDAAQIVSDEYEIPGIPHIARRRGHASDVFNQYSGGQVPRWRNSGAGAGDSAPGQGRTSRGYTGDGYVTAGDDMRIEVRYEVVDLDSLQRAAGDLQPRDRSRLSSDEQVAEIAARLDPVRLMPSPEADRGAPIVGPDNVIESGNGRVMAISRAAEQHPDRYAAYVDQIRDAGYDVPEGMTRPALIGRRVSAMTDPERQAFVRQANTSAVARMSPTERAAADAATLTEDTVRLFDGSQSLTHAANKPFTTRALASLPQAERAALVDAKGALNAEGIRRLKGAMFARAYAAPDILARYAETNAGELRSLIDALEDASPAWAALKADIAAGQVRPEMDITPWLMDAMRLIASAREVAAANGKAVAAMMEELLADVDLLEGAVSPLTVALVRKFAPGGRAASADRISEFLKRYAEEARKIGTTEPSLFGDPPSPIDALRAIDPEGFAGLTELGRTRVEPSATAPVIEDPVLDSFDDGALSPGIDQANRDALKQIRADLAGLEDITVDGPDGEGRTVADLLDDLDDDDALETIIDLCSTRAA